MIGAYSLYLDDAAGENDMADATKHWCLTYTSDDRVKDIQASKLRMYTSSYIKPA